jgi:hypothetical protein
MKCIVLEVDDDGCGLLEFELATDDAYLPGCCASILTRYRLHRSLKATAVACAAKPAATEGAHKDCVDDTAGSACSSPLLTSVGFVSC